MCTRAPTVTGIIIECDQGSSSLQKTIDLLDLATDTDIEARPLPAAAPRGAQRLAAAAAAVAAARHYCTAQQLPRRSVARTLESSAGTYARSGCWTT